MIYVNELLSLCKNIRNDNHNQIIIVDENGNDLYYFATLFDFYNHIDMLSISKLSIRYFVCRYHYILINVWNKKDV